jgi:hypothetical protein
MKSLLLKITFLVAIYCLGFYSGFQYRNSTDLGTAMKEHAQEVSESAKRMGQLGKEVGEKVLKEINEKPVEQ